MRRSPAAAIRSAPRGLPLTSSEDGLRRPSSSAAARSTGGATGRRCSTCCGRRPTRHRPARGARACRPSARPARRQDNRDALFVGFAGNLVVGVWVGRDDNKSLGQDQRRDRAGADLAQLHGPGARGRRTRRARRCRASSGSGARPARAGSARARCPRSGAKAREPLREIIRQIEKLFE